MSKMICPHSDEKPAGLYTDYDSLGYENGMSEARYKEVHARWLACEVAGHKRGFFDTYRGDHQRWCEECRYRWGWDSGD